MVEFIFRLEKRLELFLMHIKLNLNAIKNRVGLKSRSLSPEGESAESYAFVLVYRIAVTERFTSRLAGIAKRKVN